MTFLKVLGTLGLLFAFTILPSQAQVITWDNGGTGNLWSTADNWSTNAVPTASNDVVVGGPIGTSVVDSSLTINSLDVGFTSRTVSINADVDLTVTGDLFLRSSNDTLAGAGNFSVGGLATLGSGTNLIGTGTGSFNGGVMINAASTVDVSRDITSSGTSNWMGDGGMILDGATWTNTAGSTFTRTQGGFAAVMEINAGSQFVNEGTFELTGNNAFTVNSMGGGSFVNSGEVLVTSGTLNFANYSDNGGTINVQSGASFNTGGTLTSTGGTLTGTGTINDSVSITNGTIAPGNSIGTLTIAGNLTLDATTLAIEIGAAGDIDLLDVNGTVTLTNSPLVTLTEDSPLTLTAANIGDRFKFLESDALVGAGFQTTPLNLGIFEFAIGYDDVALGGTGNAYLELTAVPEPSSLMMLGLVGAGLGLRRRRR